MKGSQGFPLTKPMTVNTGLHNCAACDKYITLVPQLILVIISSIYYTLLTCAVVYRRRQALHRQY